MLFTEISDIKKLVHRHGIKPFFIDTIKYLEDDFKQWPLFEKKTRDASHFIHGVIELMPIYKNPYYSFKYVNGHPNNTKLNKLCVFAFGCLSDTHTGYPLLLSEMTLLTAVRTACTAAISSKYLARKDSKVLAIIGTGAQSEFLSLAHLSFMPLQEIRYYDTDAAAMKKFHHNIKSHDLTLTPCTSSREAIQNADIIITCTASKAHAKVLNYSDMHEGCHLIGIGGDCPGKTELDEDILRHSKVVVEYYPQSRSEGEIQNLGEEEHQKVLHGELWELVAQKKPGRTSDSENTFFDSVGFAMEDFSILRLVYELTQKYQLGKEVDLIPSPNNPKDLFQLLS